MSTNSLQDHIAGASHVICFYLIKDEVLNYERICLET